MQKVSCENMRIMNHVTDDLVDKLHLYSTQEDIKRSLHFLKAKTHAQTSSPPFYSSPAVGL